MHRRGLCGRSTSIGDQRATSSTTNNPHIHHTRHRRHYRRAEQHAGATTAHANGDSIYVIGNPGEGQNTITPASYPATANFATPKPKRQYDALEVTLERRFSKNWFGSVNYTLSRLYGNYSGLANSDEIQTPTTGITSKTAQQQEGSIARQGSNSHIGWDIDEIMWDAHGNLNPLGRLATDRPHEVNLYGTYRFKLRYAMG